MSVGRIKIFSETTGNRGNILEKMAVGAIRAGLDCELVTGFDYEACDVAVMWGLAKEGTGRSRLSKLRQKLCNDIVSQHRGRVVMMEAPVFGRQVSPHVGRSWLVKKLFPNSGRWTPRFLATPRLVIDPYSHFRIGFGGFPDDGGLSLSPFCENRWTPLAHKLGLPAVKPFRKDGGMSW